MKGNSANVKEEETNDKHKEDRHYKRRTKRNTKDKQRNTLKMKRCE